MPAASMLVYAALAVALTGQPPLPIPVAVPPAPSELQRVKVLKASLRKDLNQLSLDPSFASLLMCFSAQRLVARLDGYQKGVSKVLGNFNRCGAAAVGRAAQGLPGMLQCLPRCPECRVPERFL